MIASAVGAPTPDHRRTQANTQANMVPATPNSVAEPKPSHASACASYCNSYARECGQSLEFTDPEACSKRCDQWALGAADTVGDSVMCRAGFLSAGLTSCVAAAPASPICVNENPGCSAFCNGVLAACGDDSGFEGQADCQDWCRTTAPGTPGTTADTVGCRAAFVAVAATDDAWCSAAALDSSLCADGLL